MVGKAADAEGHGNASFHGRYFHAYIKNRYDYRRIA
jgi:hypothetical protein